MYRYITLRVQATDRSVSVPIVAFAMESDRREIFRGIVIEIGVENGPVRAVWL